MIQCAQCEFYSSEPDGRRIFRCDPFVNIKEPECLQKWQLLRLDMLVGTFQAMAQMQHKLAPLQEKLFKYVKRELEELDESEKWKVDDSDDFSPEQDDTHNPPPNDPFFR